MHKSSSRPTSITVAALLIVFYTGMVILWDLLSPFERPYAQGPVSVVFGFRVFGVWAQLMHVLQLIVAVALAYGLWTMRYWGWQLVQFVVGYMVVSNMIWISVYQEYHRILFALFYLAIVNLLLLLTYPHRERFV